MSKDITLTIRYWLERVLSCLGVPNAERQECLACASVALGQVVVMFVQPHYGEQSYIIARALVGELPPQGQCESLYQMALEVQGMLCGPHTPVLCLDWPARTMMVSCCLDTTALPADDAAQVLLAIREMALQWRVALVQPSAAAADVSALATEGASQR